MCAIFTIPCPLFFFNTPAPTQIYPLSLHDALPISLWGIFLATRGVNSRLLVGDVVHLRLTAAISTRVWLRGPRPRAAGLDRKSTRLNSSHLVISYAVFCLKKKNIVIMSSVVQQNYT